MPIHDWTRVNAGTFHSFHVAWLPEMQRALNGGLLPDGYYALAEQVAGSVIPDVLTLQGPSDTQADASFSEASDLTTAGDEGGVAVAEAPPRVAIIDTASEEAQFLAARRRQLVIRHTTGDRIVALIEIVSPGNKERRDPFEAFVDKAVGAIDHGYHLLIIDLFPPGPFDPNGVHGAIWNEFRKTYTYPKDKPLTLSAYAAQQTIAGAVTCYVQPVAVGDELIPMPLFLDPGHYINVPLEQTYLAAYEGVPKRWKRVIEGR